MFLVVTAFFGFCWQTAVRLPSLPSQLLQQGIILAESPAPALTADCLAFPPLPQFAFLFYHAKTNEFILIKCWAGYLTQASSSRQCQIPRLPLSARPSALLGCGERDRGAGKKQQCHFWGKAETCPTISDVPVVRDRVKMMKWKVYKGELQPLFAALCFMAQPLRLGLKPWQSHHSRAAFSTPFILKHSKETNERGTAFAEKATESQLCQTSLPRLPGLFEPWRRGNKT